MQEIQPELIEEVDDCIARIKAFQASNNRRIQKYIKRSRKGKEGLQELQQFQLPIPPDFAALYVHYNGIEPGGNLSMWEWSVFLNFEWPTIRSLVRSNKIMRASKVNPLEKRIEAFFSAGGRSLQIDPSSERDGQTPLLMTLGNLSRNHYIAFDSTLAMLRSVCAAQDAGIIRYEENRVVDENTGKTIREENEIDYDVAELWEVIKPFNPRADYWHALIGGTVDFDKIQLEENTSGVIYLEPEVKKIILEDFLTDNQNEPRK